MPRYSQRSLNFLDTCHLDLQRLFKRVILAFDNSIICGRRGEEEQESLFLQKRTKVHYPDSKHNAKPPNPSLAIDSIPYPHSWKFEGDILVPHGISMDVVHNIERWAMYAGIVKGIAFQMGIPLGWGGDFDGDNQLSDNKFDDWPHYWIKE